jgi:hypothetical protein
MRAIRKLRDVEELLRMHGDKQGYEVRVKSLRGIHHARSIQRLLRRKVKEMGWRVHGMEHLDAAVHVHQLLGASASLLDEVIFHIRERVHLLHDDQSTSRQSAALLPFDSSASAHLGASASTLLDATGRERATIAVSGSASAHLGATDRGRATFAVGGTASALLGATDRGGATFAVGGTASALLGATGRGGATLAVPVSGSASAHLGATDRGPATLPLGATTSALLGATGRDRATIAVNGSASAHLGATDCDRATFPVTDPSASGTRRVSNDNRTIAEPTLEAGTGGRGSLLLAPAVLQLDESYDLDFATHRLFASGTALRQHQMGSSSLQLVVQGLGRKIEQVADALLAAHLPPEMLLKDVVQVKKSLHEVWALTIPASDFRLL